MINALIISLVLIITAVGILLSCCTPLCYERIMA